MKIFKAHFLPKNTIYQLLGKVEKDIRESYTGGAVDVYIPHNGKGGDILSNEKDTLYYYDITSLYPYVMCNYPVPVGKRIAFEGDIRSVCPDAYGFFYCKIKTPTFLIHPILQKRVKTRDGTRTVAGLGSWEGWLFSGEMDLAIKKVILSKS